MALINVVDLTFSYEGSYENIFENVSFQIDSDWKLGFVGRNGRGKTTFLKLLMGQEEYNGTITADLNFEYFPYAVSDMEKMTLEIVQGMAAGAEDWEIIRELSLLGSDAEILYRSFTTLSHGERTKVLLAALFLKENTFLLIDEPTNHLDMEARELLAQYLNKKKGFILVSHDRTFIDNCVDHILSINKCDIEVQKGNFSSWWENQKLKEQYELSEYERLKKDIRRLESAARRTSGWSDKVEKTKKGVKSGGLKPDRGFVGHKSAKMMKRAKTLERRQQDQIESKSKLLRNVEEQEELKIMPLQFHAEKLVELDNVSVFYGEKKAVSGFSMTICRGERLALRGRNGGGKSSVLKLICGSECGENTGVCREGEIRKNPALKISYVSQDTSELSGELRMYIQKYDIQESLFKAILRKFGFSREQFEKKLDYYSAGQKKKVMLARSLCERAHLYIWDEPLNYIDVISRMQIEELLTEHRPTILFVEHDKAFCEAVATGEVWM